ncbi:unnamed protein product [Effrenium voratum]|uniref:FYVE-type domain-containing protein n=1 Tax=Effrenium voratum TaxID=2562239 RepID=A0AA36MP88_9DINO|nr:unnamed protein product [Effrenium voratum]
MNSLMQPELGASQLPGSDASSAVASVLMQSARLSPRLVAPGVRQDLTGCFLRQRDLFVEKRRSAMPSRLEWLLSIIEEGDADQLRCFVEAYRRMKDPLNEGDPCEYCNARLTSNKWFKASEAIGVQGVRCMICAKWHCEKHRQLYVTLSFGVNQSVKLDCCERCHAAVDVLRWHKDRLPDCLPATSRQLMVLYTELSEELTKLAGAIAQLDGATRLVEQLVSQLEEVSTPDSFKECMAAMQQSRQSATAAEGATSQCLKQLAALRCTSANGESRGTRNALLRDALARHGWRQLEQLKPRLKAASTRANELQKRKSRGFLSRWIGGE